MVREVQLDSVQSFGEPIGSVYAASRAARLISSGPTSGTKKGDGWWRSDADERVLDFAARFGGLSLRQVSRGFYRRVYATARERVRFMVEAGLLDRADNLRWAGPVVWPTATGMHAIESSLRPPGMPSDERMLHRLLVADNALRLTTSMGAPVVSEREIRSMEGETATSEAAEKRIGELGVDGVSPSVDASGRDRWWSVPIAGGDRQHWPDFVLATPRRLIAVEVEIALKDASRMNAIVRAYRDAYQRGHLGQVLWLVTPDVRTALEGYRMLDGQWSDGVLQRFGMLPAGQAPDWSQKGLPMVVRGIDAHDEGLQYALDQRVLPPAVRCSQPRWRRWRKVWQQEAPEVEFTHWARVESVFRRLRRIQ